MLRQSGDRKLPLAIRRKNSMPDSNPDHDATGVRRRITDEISRIVDSAARRQPVSSERSWIVERLSWLGGWILEGLAMYGEAICPCLVDYPDDFDTSADASHWPSAPSLPLQQNPWAQSTEVPSNVDIHTWLASAPSAWRGIPHSGMSAASNAACDISQTVSSPHTSLTDDM
jgi:hypothetical protein